MANWAVAVVAMPVTACIVMGVTVTVPRLSRPSSAPSSTCSSSVVTSSAVAVVAPPNVRSNVPEATADTRSVLYTVRIWTSGTGPSGLALWNRSRDWMRKCVKRSKMPVERPRVTWYALSWSNVVHWLPSMAAVMISGRKGDRPSTDAPAPSASTVTAASGPTSSVASATSGGTLPRLRSDTTSGSSMDPGVPSLVPAVGSNVTV